MGDSAGDVEAFAGFNRNAVEACKNRFSILCFNGTFESLRFRCALKTEIKISLASRPDSKDVISLCLAERGVQKSSGKRDRRMTLHMKPD